MNLQNELDELNRSNLAEKSKREEYEIQINGIKQKSSLSQQEVEKLKKQKEQLKAQLDESHKLLNQSK